MISHTTFCDTIRSAETGVKAIAPIHRSRREFERLLRPAHAEKRLIRLKRAREVFKVWLQRPMLVGGDKSQALH